MRTIVLCLLVALPSLVAAQMSPETVENLMQSAKEGGMQVIVISPDGEASTEPSAVEGLNESLMMTTQERLAAFRVTLREKLQAAPASVEEVVFILNGQSPTGHYSAYFRVLFWTLALLVGAELVVRFTVGNVLIRPRFVALQKENPVGYTDKLPILLLRTLIEFGLLALVALLSYITGLAIFGESEDSTVQLTVAFIYASYVTARGVVFLWRMILSPYLERYRIPKISTPDARKLYWWLLTVATIAVIVINVCDWLEELGISYNVHAVLSSTLTLAVVLANIAMVIVNHRGITGIILNGQITRTASAPARFVARIWAPAIIVYFLVAWAEMTYRLIEETPLGWPLISGFYMVLLTVLVVYAIVGYLIERVFHRRRILEQIQAQRAIDDAQDDAAVVGSVDDDTMEDEPALMRRAAGRLDTFEDLSRRVANILALFAALWAITAIWHIDLGMGAAERVFPRVYDVLAILFIGYVIYHAARIWIDQKIIEEGGDQVEVAPGDEGGAGGASRLATLLPLFRNFLLLVIVLAVGIIALSNLGLNVSALFAGAGIVGLAIGFGAQTLVRDIFSGAFFLFDDAFRKGEYIDVGSVKGTVEKISVRSFQLRHHLGPLHTIPFGEIQHLTNFSRDWVMMKLPLRVTYDTDVEKVRKLIKKLGLQLAEDPLIGHQFLQPLKSQGVIEMQDSAMIIRVKFMTKPGDQWVLRKRVYQEIRDLFEREGIKFAHREVTVRIAGDADALTDKQKEAVGAAALSTMDEDDIPGAMPDDGKDDR